MGYAHLTHAGILTVLHILGAVEAPVGSVVARGVLERFLVMIQGSLHVIAIDGIPLQHSILGNQAMSTLGQENLVAEFHWLQGLAPLDSSSTP